jgi:hypothetical protein
MQRKITFKFYDQKRNRLMDVLSIDWGNGLIVCTYGGQGWLSLIEDGDLLPYTDRKDKYRKEIFEGHIIIEHDHLGGKLPLEVYWDATESGFRCRRASYHGPLPDSKNTEVIGNRYENPELLQARDE